MAVLIRLPPEGDAVPARLELSTEGDSVRWTREFGGFRAVSEQRFRNGCFVELAGPFGLVMRPRRDADSMVHEQVGLHVFGIRVPMLFGPRVCGRIGPGDDDHSWTIDVRIGHALLGILCSYSGRMTAQ